MAEAAGPKAVLFVSIDLVGSSRYKTLDDKWPDVYFAVFESILGKFLKGPAPEFPFVLWKFLGDELVFTLERQRAQSTHQFTSRT